ncbi:MAG: hypothetical protein ACI4PF_04105, partial [Christensenellales bacterium]
QISDTENNATINKRKRFNCIYQSLLKSPDYNKYYYKFFYEEETKDQPTKEPIYINVAKLIKNYPNNTIDKINAITKNLIFKYNIGEVIKTSEIDKGLLYYEPKDDIQSILSYLKSNNLIDVISSNKYEIMEFKLNLNAKIYIEKGCELNMKEQNIQNITNNTTINHNDNSTNVFNAGKINKSNIGENKISSNKTSENQVNTTIAKEVKGNWLTKLFKKK